MVAILSIGTSATRPLPAPGVQVGESVPHSDPRRIDKRGGDLVTGRPVIGQPQGASSLQCPRLSPSRTSFSPRTDGRHPRVWPTAASSCHGRRDRIGGIESAISARTLRATTRLVASSGVNRSGREKEVGVAQPDPPSVSTRSMSTSIRSPGSPPGSRRTGRPGGPTSVAGRHPEHLRRAGNVGVRCACRRGTSARSRATWSVEVMTICRPRPPASAPGPSPPARVVPSRQCRRRTQPVHRPRPRRA